MMSKSAYLYDDGDHNGPHVMFFTALKDGKDWGAGASGSPVFAGPYWFLSCRAHLYLRPLVNASKNSAVDKSVDGLILCGFLDAFLNETITTDL